MMKLIRKIIHREIPTPTPLPVSHKEDEESWAKGFEANQIAKESAADASSKFEELAAIRAELQAVKQRH